MIADNKTILVIDDEHEMRVALKEVLLRSGYDVCMSRDGHEAIKEMSVKRFDAVITDMKMPNMSGLSILKETKKLSYPLPVIMITAYGTVDNAVEVMKAGAFDYILKPFSLDSIEFSVKRALSHKDQPKEENKDIPLFNRTVQHSRKRTADKDIITCSPVMKSLLSKAKSVASSDATVLIQGESGTGKELFARFIYNLSRRRGKPFIAVNCASLPEGLLESELFGHEKGAFTGAIGRKPGKFELADNGTILLDEITEMPLYLQAKLLRVLQEREIDVVGGREPVPVDIRVIATTNRNIVESMKKGDFRDDLYYRINVIPIKIPPLRKRPEDITLLSNYFFEKYKDNNIKIKGISKRAVGYLKKAYWAGNVRELENNIERAVLLCDSDYIDVPHFCCEEDIKTNHEEGSVNNWPHEMPHTVREMEKRLILKTVKDVQGSRTDAARRLGISIRTLRNKLKEYKEEEGI